MLAGVTALSLTKSYTAMEVASMIGIALALYVLPRLPWWSEAGWARKLLTPTSWLLAVVALWLLIGSIVLALLSMSGTPQIVKDLTFILPLAISIVGWYVLSKISSGEFRSRWLP
jgi:hypothetical protein